MTHIAEIIRNGYTLDCDDYSEFLEISEDEISALFHLTPEALYNHIKEHSIGKVTPCGKTRYLPKYKIGRFEMSLQNAYFLYCYRDDKYGWRSEHNEPCTEEEFAAVTKNCDSTIDVLLYYNGKPICAAGQSSCRNVAEWFHQLVLACTYIPKRTIYELNT